MCIPVARPSGDAKQDGAKKQSAGGAAPQQQAGEKLSTAIDRLHAQKRAEAQRRSIPRDE